MKSTSTGKRRRRVPAGTWAAALVCLPLAFAFAQTEAPNEPPAEMPVADPAELAFEEGRWEDAIAEYRELLAAYPEDRVSLLRIAQAQRELGRHDEALATLDQARTALAPEAMIDLERARNLALMGRSDDALAALDAADHNGVRALALLEEAPEFEQFRGLSRFERVHRAVRARVYPCESLPPAGDFDFWIGRWEVRNPDGTLVGRNTIEKRDGGCAVVERWEGAGGSSGTSMSFFLPSRGEWRQVWTGSSGTLFDITGRFRDGAMRMEGTIEYAAQDKVVAFRGTWTQSADGRVRQRMEEFDVIAQTWVLWFDGIYRRLD